ncbi:tRNA-splicing endonuclease subunit Sen15 [Trichoplax sp. H2]|nr:tRNA-splicing endonuclease subunit Sen15 [Trichoplax sp. H2]|eukprot:RDD43383.1 tRNA-splicing endonuclease subunit Sen15 [Trichoplax sp. H2]
MEPPNIPRKSILDRYTWLDNHPKAEEIKRWNIGNSTYQKAVLQVYLDLCEVKNWFQLAIHGLPLHEIIYITGKSDRKNQSSVVLPVNAQSKTTMTRLLETIDQISDNRSIVLAVYESDSTIVYYELENLGLNDVFQ